MSRLLSAFHARTPSFLLNSMSFCTCGLRWVRFSNDLCMPITTCTRSDGSECVVAMRNVEMDLWSMGTCSLVHTAKNRVQDWSSHHLGTGIDQRLLVSAKHFVAYAGYRFVTVLIDVTCHSVLCLSMQCCCLTSSCVNRILQIAPVFHHERRQTKQSCGSHSV